VLFRVRDVFGGSSDDTLSIDLHEDWLTSAGRNDEPTLG
jgi:hypothetical protein